MIDCSALEKYIWSRRRPLFGHTVCISIQASLRPSNVLLVYVCVCVSECSQNLYLAMCRQKSDTWVSSGTCSRVVRDHLCHDLIRPSVPPINCIAYRSTVANLAGEKRCSLSIRSFLLAKWRHSSWCRCQHEF